MSDCVSQETIPKTQATYQSRLPATLVLSEVFPPQHGGSGKWLWEIYRRQPAGHYLLAVGDSHGADVRDVDYPQMISRLDLAMNYRGIRKWESCQRYLSQIYQAARLASKYSIKTLHAARPLSEGLVARGVKLWKGTPYLCYVHGEDINVASSSRELSLMTRSVLRHADILIANSSFTRQLLVNEWAVPESKAILMTPGVDTAYFSPDPLSENRPQHWRNRTVILTVGRLQARKGHDTVIQAVSRLKSLFPNILYVIAGDGEMRSELQRTVRDLELEGYVQFTGAVSERKLRVFYQHCDLFVLANRTIGKDLEGFGMVLLEAQACGKPVIAGASGGTVDAVQHGVTGWIVACEAPDLLTSLISRELRSKRTLAEVGQRGRQFCVNSFDWSRLAGQARRVFQNHELRHA